MGVLYRQISTALAVGLIAFVPGFYFPLIFRFLSARYITDNLEITLIISLFLVSIGFMLSVSLLRKNHFPSYILLVSMALVPVLLIVSPTVIHLFRPPVDTLGGMITIAILVSAPMIVLVMVGASCFSLLYAGNRTWYLLLWFGFGLGIVSYLLLFTHIPSTVWFKVITVICIVAFALLATDRNINLPKWNWLLLGLLLVLTVLFRPDLIHTSTVSDSHSIAVRQLQSVYGALHIDKDIQRGNSRLEFSASFQGKKPATKSIWRDQRPVFVIPQAQNNANDLRHLSHTLQSLPYLLADKPSVYLFGLDGGTQLMLAGYHQASSIVTVEPNLVWSSFFQKNAVGYLQKLLAQDFVQVIHGDPRNHLASNQRRFDIIQISASSQQARALPGLSDRINYVFTREAIQDYVSHLNTNGFLVIHVYEKPLLQNTTNLVRLLYNAQLSTKANVIKNRLVIVRGAKSVLVMLKKGKIGIEERHRIRNFNKTMRFDPVFYPGISTQEINRYQVLNEPAFHNAVIAVFNKPVPAYDRWTLLLPSDNNPFFFQRTPLWPSVQNSKQAANLLSDRNLYFGIIGTVIAFLFLLIPTSVLYKKQETVKSYRYTLVLFLSGIASMTILFFAYHSLIRFVGTTETGNATVLGAGLFAMGMAGLLSRRKQSECILGHCRSLGFSILVLMLILVSYVILLPVTLYWMMLLNSYLKLVFTFLLFFPLAFYLGIVFVLISKSAHDGEPALLSASWGLYFGGMAIGLALSRWFILLLGFSGLALFAVVLLLCSLVLLYNIALPGRQEQERATDNENQQTPDVDNL